MSEVKLKNLNKVYPNGYHAVIDANLTIPDKAFMVMVGPSGCGKTTTLRMIAGIEEISSGDLYMGDALVNGVPSKDRDIAMVFQNYALYPHMSIRDNLSFGLMLRKTPKKEIAERVDHVAKILDLDMLLDRKPKQLSGGQRQRVALGRAIVRRPNVFLMDEPLSNLDAKLRVQMRAELIKLHRQLDATFIFVTHDQTEAMTMGTHICVMKDCLIQQVADPKTVYNKPVNTFVATFIGSPQMNLLVATVVETDQGLGLTIGDRVIVPNDLELLAGLKAYVGKEVTLGIRPEDVVIGADHGSPKLVGPTLMGHVEVLELLGPEMLVYIDLPGNVKFNGFAREAAGFDLVAKVHPDAAVKVGETLELALDLSKLHVFDAQSGQRV